MPELQLEIFNQPKVLQIIGESVAETISSYTRGAVKACASIASDPEYPGAMAVGSAIQLKGPNFSFEILLLIDQTLFLSFYEAATQQTADEVTPDVASLVGEFMNVAFNTMDPKLRALGFPVKSSFPVVLCGPKLAALTKLALVPKKIIPLEGRKTSFPLAIFSGNSLPIKFQFER